MAARETEAIILRTYPFQEADKIVSFFSRSEGRMRGVAPSARRSIRRFGASLELLSHVRLRFQEKAQRDLVRLESCDLLESFCNAQPGYEQVVAGSCIAEICEQLLPEREANDPFFRLALVAASEISRSNQIWRPLTYFDLWAVKLAGFLPPLDACIRCRSELGAGDACWFRPQWEGLLCRACRGEEAWSLSAESRRIAQQMLSTPLPEISGQGWSKPRADDLRRFLGQQLERHLERKLITRRQLDELA